MKIIGGALKGRNFYMPAVIRPTPDIIRKAIFDIVGQSLEGMRFLDLFAGSGAVGIEAISRSAKNVIFVEKDSRCYDIIEENLKVLNIVSLQNDTPSYFVINADTFVAIKQFHQRGERFDIVFVDPPYQRGLAKKTLKTLSAYDILHPNSIIIIQHDKNEILPEAEGRILSVRERKYGNSFVSIYRNSL